MRIVDNPNPPKPAELEPAENKELINDNGNKSKRFSDDEITLLLTCLVMNGGKYKQTSRQALEELGIEVHHETLERWRKVYYPSQYLEIQRTLADKLSSKLAGRITDVAQQSISITEQLQEQLEDKLQTESFDLKDLPIAIRNMAQTSEITVRNRQLLEDKPTEILEARNIEQTLSDLEESEIIVDAEVVEDQDESDSSDSSIALPL